MFKPQMKFQKILFSTLLIFSAVVFIYSLGLMTNLYGLYQVQAIGSVKGSKLFYEMQPYNNRLVILAIIPILSRAPSFFQKFFSSFFEIVKTRTNRRNKKIAL